MAEATPPAPPATILTTVRGLAGRIARALSLSRLQSIVAILAGSVTVAGAAFSIAPVSKATGTGQFAAIVRAAGSQRPVPDATVEVLTSDNTLVATLTPDSAGRASGTLREGIYVVRITHPRYAADVRRIDMRPHQTIEIKAALRAGGSAPSGHSINVDRTVNRGVNAIKRMFGF